MREFWLALVEGSPDSSVREFWLAALEISSASSVCVSSSWFFRFLSLRDIWLSALEGSSRFSACMSSGQPLLRVLRVPQRA